MGTQRGRMAADFLKEIAVSPTKLQVPWGQLLLLSCSVTSQGWALTVVGECGLMVCLGYPHQEG